MIVPVLLASGSEIRARLMRQAGIVFDVSPARVDEASVKAALEAEAAPPRDISDTLAELKARKVSDKHPGALVIGCDQVLDFDGRVLSKPEDEVEVLEQLKSLRGRPHDLLSAVVIVEDGKPVWREVGKVTLVMRQLSDAYLQDYVARNWDSIRHSVGGYKLEEEGVRLFSEIRGDYFTVLGLPVLSLISYLTLRGILEQ